MKPYYETHAIGMLYLLILVIWYGAEIIQFARQRQWRKGAARIGPRAFWPACAIAVAAAITMLFVAPHIAPAARFGDDPVAFAIGMALLVPGAALRLWSFQALGQYFTFTVKTSLDQQVVTAGPYRLLRHPGYAGGMVATIGIGVEWGNWVSMATLSVLTLAIVLWRIHIEENALLAALDDRYRSYALHHKRLVPLVW